MASEFLKRKAEERAAIIDKEFGKGAYGGTDDLNQKREAAASSAPKWSGFDTTSGWSDFNTETKNAYTTAKNKARNKTTIKSNLSDKERKARIKEIEDELKTISYQKQGYGRAGSYGGQANKDWLANKSKELDARKEELTAELKSLKRVGTFTASELKQFEIEDAKKEKAKLPSYDPTARVMPNQVEAYKENVTAHSEADEKIDTLKRQKELYDDITNFSKVVHTENGDFFHDFDSQWRANYRLGDLSREADKAMTEYIKNPTEENKQIAYAYDALAKEYAKNNAKALDEEGTKWSWLSKSFAGYLPQLRDQIVPELVGGGIGGLLGAAVGAPGVGSAIGAGLAVFPQSYDAIQGSVYRELLAAGVDDKTAREAAEDEALVSSLIESGETVASWALSGSGKALKAIGAAAKTSVAKGSTNAAVKFVASMAGKATNRAAKKAAKAVTRPLWNKALRVGGRVFVNGATEYAEEFTQGAVSVANREQAYATVDNEIGQYGAGNVDLHNRPTYKNADGSISTVDSVLYQIDDKFVLLPTIARDENGKAIRLETDEEILAHFRDTGEFLGEFDTQEEADAYATKLHTAQAYRYGKQIGVTADDNLWSGGAKVVKSAVSGDNPELFGELHEQGKTGFTIGVMMGGTSTAVNTIITNYANAKTVKNQNEIADTIIEDEESLTALIEEGKASGAGTVSEDIATEIETAKANGKEITREQVKSLIEANKVYIAEENRVAEKTAQPESTAREGVAEREYNTPIQDGTPSQIAEAKSINNEPISVEEAQKASGYGTSGSKLLAEVVNTTPDKSFSEIEGKTHSAYMAGRSNRVMHFDDPLKQEAYIAGQKDRIMEDAIKAKNAKNVVVNKESGFYAKNLPSDVTKTQAKIVDVLFKSVGVKGNIKTGLKGNAEIDRTTGEVFIDADFQRESGGRNVSIVFHAAHEAAMHRVVELAPEEGSALVYEMYKHFAGNEFSKFTLARQKRNAYAAQDVNISLATAMEEVSANKILELYNNDEAKFHKAINSIANGTNLQAKQGLRKYIEYLTDFIRKIGEILKGKTAQERAEIQAEINEIRRLRDMFESALSKAVENKKAFETKSDTNSAKNLEIKTNEEYNGNKSHSLKWHTDLSRNGLIELMDKIKYDIRKSNNAITDGANWLFTVIGNDSVFAIYSTDDYKNPTLLYEAKGKKGELEKNIVVNLLEEIKNGESANGKSAYVNWVSGGGWLQKVNNSKNNLTNLGRGSNNRNAGVLQRQSKRNGSRAFWNVIENLFKVQRDNRLDGVHGRGRGVRDGELNKGKSFSLKDSEGNTLTEAQQEYFKDSKVRDENGNLLVVYHGTYEDFTVFDISKTASANAFGKGHYFTSKKTDAKDNYASGNGADVRSKIEALAWTYFEEMGYTEADYESNEAVAEWNDAYDKAEDFYKSGKVMQGYLNIKNPVYARGSELYDGNGDFVSARSAEYLKELGYDGIIDYGVFEKFGGFQELDADTVHYVAFDSEQFKNIDNTNPTSNPDTRFSLKESVEETKNLIAVHNTTEEKLLGALGLGGLPSPSIAITKKDVSHEKFGDISLVFRKDTISPTDRRNKIYSGDAYTPTGVRVEYDVDDDVVQEFNKKLKELTPEWESERLPSVDAGTAEAENDSLYSAYERNYRAKLAFLKEKGKAPKVAMRTPRLSYFVSNDTVIALAKAFSAKQLNDIANTSEGVKQYKNAFLKVIRDVEDRRFVDTGIYSADEASLFDIAETARKAKQVKENKYKIKKEVDDRKTYESIDKKFTKALKAEYRAWIDENTKDAIIDKGIRNNRDLFTPSGNRRSFKQLHEPYNLGNIIKQMFSGEDKGIALFGGSPIGAAQHEYSSIADVKADSGRIQQLEQEEYDKIRDEIESDVLDLAQRMQINSDVFAVRDLLSEAIGKKTKQQADTYLKRESEGWAKYSPDFTNELWDIRERILSMPTEYFEAKPQRAVGFNEVVLAVIPKGKTALRKQLENAGVQKVVYYDKTKDGDRLAKVNSVPDVNFSLKETDTTSSKDRKQLLDIIEHLKGEFETTKFAKADPKKLAKMTREVLKEYSSQADFDETLNDIDVLYQYMANGEDGHPAVWEDVYNRAYDVAQEIVKNALVVDDYYYQEYKHLRNYLRTTPIKFYKGYDSSPIAYENFNEFRKSNFGRLKFTKDGMAIDSMYQELAGMYPEFFDEERESNTADQLERIMEVLDEIQPKEINPFDREIEGVSMHLANDLISRFFDIPQAKPTFADKAERRVVQANIKGAKKVETVRQQKDEKIKKLMATQKEKTKKQLDKLRQDRDAKVKREQEKRRDAISKMGENQKAKVLRARIMRHASDLSKKLVNPTDNQHIPYELQGAVAKLLECINLESNYSYDVESGSYKKNDEGLPTKRTQAYNDLKMVYADIASSVVVDPDLMGENGLLSGVISLADKRIADMTSSELETVWQSIRAIEASVSTANKLFSQGKFATIVDVADTLRKENVGKKEKTELKGLIGKGKKLATLDMLTPETYLHYLGNAGDSIFRMLRDAQDKHISIMKEVADFTHKALKDVDVNSLEKTIHTVKLGGEDVQLSTAQIMELYVLMKREQAKEHILVGGILPDTIEGKGLKKITKAKPARNITIAEISATLSKLTSEQKNIADKLQKYVSTVLSAYGNEASMQVYNYEKFNEKNYWTIRTNRQEINSDVEKDTAVTTVANKGMTKATKPHANTSVRIGSIFDTFASHSSDMATYAAWLGTSEDVNRIRNFVFWEEGARTGTVKDILDAVHGTQGSQYLEKLLADIAIGVKGTDNMNPFDKFIGHYKAASVGANLRVVIQQPTALLRALDMIDARYLTEGAVRPLKGWEKAKKYAPIAQWKDWGHFDINTGRQMKDVLFDNANLLEKTKQAGMWGASMADSLAWGQLWNAVEAETKARHTELEVGSIAYYETVAKRFTEIVDHTQVVDGILQRSQIMRSPDALTKMATSFMGEPTKQYNMAMSAAYDTKTTKGDARKKAVSRLGRTALSLAVAGIINACAQSIIDAMRDDDKEKKYWERWLTAFVGDGEDTKWYDTNLADTVNPLNYVPFAKDIVSILRGYDVKRMDTEAITKVLDATKNMYKSISGEGKYTIAESSAQLFAEIARMYGVPVANVKRDVKSLVMAIALETDSYLMQYRMEKAMLDINYAGNSKNFMDILFNAYNNDREAYEKIYYDMIESGFDADALKKGMDDRMKNAQGVKEVSDLTKRYMTPTTEKKYDSSMKQISSSEVWKTATAEQRQDAKADLYEFLTSDRDDFVKTREEAKAAGVDETEYTLWKLAIEMADQPKGEEGSGNYDSTEKAKAINSLDLGNEEIAYFFGRGANEYAKEEIEETLDAGIDMLKYVNFKAATSNMEADKNAKGNSIPNSKKRKVVKYLDNADLTPEEWAYFYYEIMNYKK